MNDLKSETTVGDNIEKSEGEWNFDESVAEEFDKHVRNSIPNYDLIQDQVVKISNWYLSSNDNITYYDLGCSTGTTIKQVYDSNDWKFQPNIVGVDEVRPMLKRAEEKLEDYEGVKLTQRDLSKNPSFNDADLITSLFTMSFLSEEDRQNLFNSIHNGLKEGGALVFCEKTYPDSGRFQSMYREHYWDFKRENFNDEEIIGKAKSLRGQLRPLTQKEYIEMLKEAGFKEENIETFYQFYMWWGVVARK